MSTELCAALGVMGAASSSSSGARRQRRSRTVSRVVAVATCAAVCAVAGHLALPGGSPLASSERSLLAFVAGGPGGLRSQPLHRAEPVVRQQCSGGTFAVPYTDTAPVPWLPSDFVQEGKFRGAARLVRTAGEKLSEVAPLGSVFSSCATALRGAAAALLEERWIDAEGMIGTARDHIKASAGAVAPLNPRQALSDLVIDLEARAQDLSEVSQDALEDAAGALRAAARLFVSTETQAKRSQARGRGSYISEDAVVASFLQDPQLVSARVAARLVAATKREDRTKMLRTLAKHHHPDRNPGREDQVLPTFLLVQELREEWRQQLEWDAY